MTNLIHAPWTAEQVTALNAFQHHGRMHPFTCGAEHASGRSPVLIATNGGWVCPDPQCVYRQDWAHAFMVERGAAVSAAVAPPTNRAAVLREAADAIEKAADEHPDQYVPQGLYDAADRLRRMADETATETPAATTVPCSGTLGTPHQPHNWEPQPGMEPVHCPGTRKPAARCTCQYIAESWIQMDHSPDCPAAGARQDGTET